MELVVFLLLLIVVLSYYVYRKTKWLEDRCTSLEQAHTDAKNKILSLLIVVLSHYVCRKTKNDELEDTYTSLEELEFDESFHDAYTSLEELEFDKSFDDTCRQMWGR